MFRILLAAAAIGTFASAAAQTRVVDTLRDATGNPQNGYCQITYSGFTTAAGAIVGGGQYTFILNNGLIDITLAPTVGASPATTYLVQCTVSGATRVQTQTWSVPVSASSVNLAAIVVEPTSPIVSTTNVLTVRFADGVIPTGTLDGVNATFYLPGVPNPTSGLQLYRNGTLQTQGVDYTLSSQIIVFVPGAIPQRGDLVTASYRYGTLGPIGTLGGGAVDGEPGAVGPQGPTGAAGCTILSGGGPPAPSVGGDCNYYVDEAAGRFWGPKTSGSWTTWFALLGPPGPAGLQGSTGPTGDPGPTGPQGPSGSSTATYSYSANVTYASGDTVAATAMPGCAGAVCACESLLIGNGSNTGGGNQHVEIAFTDANLNSTPTLFGSSCGTGVCGNAFGPFSSKSGTPPTWRVTGGSPAAGDHFSVSFVCR